MSNNSLTFHKNKKPHTNMKMRNKGKVYPSTSTTTTTTTPVTSPAGDYLSVLNLLPAAILSLAVVLSLEDREVLAYMITRSIKSTNPSSSTFQTKKTNTTSHKSPLFECDCFDCYTSFWYKWDSSPNRELIHQAIEAFEESLTNNEQYSKKKSKKKEKMGHRRLAGKPHTPAAVESPSGGVQVLQECEVIPFDEKVEESVEDQKDGVLGNVVEEELPELLESPEMAVVVRPATGGQNKGLARKVLPDVIGLFNWRLFSLWSPNV